MVINSEKMISVLDKVYSFLIDSGDVFVYEHPTDSFEPGMFESGKGLFMTTWLGNCANLREMDADFGISRRSITAPTTLTEPRASSCRS